MLTSNPGWLKGAFGNFKKRPEPAFFMLNIDGKKLSIPTFGLMQ
jgi:hypothetical protein